MGCRHKDSMPHTLLCFRFVVTGAVAFGIFIHHANIVYFISFYRYCSVSRSLALCMMPMLAIATAKKKHKTNDRLLIISLSLSLIHLISFWPKIGRGNRLAGGRDGAVQAIHDLSFREIIKI